MSNQAIPVDAEELARLREELLQCRSKLAIAAENSAGDDELIANMLSALHGVLPYMEAAEDAGLVGHEGCHWPVESVRAAIAAVGQQPREK